MTLLVVVITVTMRLCVANMTTFGAEGAPPAFHPSVASTVSLT